MLYNSVTEGHYDVVQCYRGVIFYSTLLEKGTML